MQNQETVLKLSFETSLSSRRKKNILVRNDIDSQYGT